MLLNQRTPETRQRWTGPHAKFKFDPTVHGEVPFKSSKIPGVALALGLGGAGPRKNPPRSTRARRYEAKDDGERVFAPVPQLPGEGAYYWDIRVGRVRDLRRERTGEAYHRDISSAGEAALVRRRIEEGKRADIDRRLQDLKEMFPRFVVIGSQDED